MPDAAGSGAATPGPAAPDPAAPDPAAPDPAAPGGHRRLAVAVGSIAAITLLARVVGFGRWFVFSHSVGATCVGTVYQSANAVPNVMYEIAAGGVLAAVAVPLISSALGRGDRRTADAVASSLLTWAVLVLVPAALLVALAAEPLARMLLGTGCADAVALGTSMLRVFAVQVPLYGIGIVLSGVLHAHRRFVAAALAPLLSSIVVIVTYLAYRSLVEDPAAPIALVPTAATTVLAVGTTLGVVALALPLLGPVRAAGVHLRPTLRLPDGIGPRLSALAAGGLLAVLGQQLATLGVIRLANTAGGDGVINVHTYGQAVMLLPVAVLAVPVAVATFPSLAALAETDHHTARRTLQRAWAATVMAGLAGAMLLVAVAAPVGSFFTALDAAEPGGDAARTLAALPAVLTALAPAVVALAAVGLLSRASYVRGHARLAGLVVGLGWVAGLAFSAAASWGRPTDGPRTVVLLAAGTSGGQVVAALALAVIVARAWGASSLHLPARASLSLLCGSMLGGGAGWLLGHRVHVSTAWGAGVLAIACAAAALAVLVVVLAVLDRGTLGQLRGLVRRGASRHGTSAGVHQDDAAGDETTQDESGQDDTPGNETAQDDQPRKGTT